MLPSPANAATVIISAALALALLAGCVDSTPSSDTSKVPTSAAPSESLPPTWGSGPQAPVDSSAPKPSTVAWTVESRGAATEAAVKFMAAYARPGTAQPVWADALAPYASVELMVSLRKVDTTYLTTKDPATSGDLQADDTNPYNGIVTLGTSDGPWQLGVHRQPDGSWRVASLQPPVRQGH